MKIATVILGATGYVSGELLRLLSMHSHLELVAAVSGSHSGKLIADIFPHLRSTYPDERFCNFEQLAEKIRPGNKLAIFSAAPHGKSATLVRNALNLAKSLNSEVHVVDASADFRYANADDFEAVYGGKHSARELLNDFVCAVPEHQKVNTRQHAGHPGCFATAILLATVPLYNHGVVNGDIFASATTGSTGSGRTPQIGTHHPIRNSNLYAYKPLAHRHAPEIQQLIKTATGANARVNFVPHSGPFARGIYATVQASCVRGLTRDKLLSIFRDDYENCEFVRILDAAPILKDVVASNYADIGIDVKDGSLVIMCAIDNLVKGAAGGSVQWMNRLWSLADSDGLRLPAPAWT